MPIRAWAMLLTLSVLWGGSFLFNRVAVAEIPTLTVVFSRVALGALLLVAAARLGGVGLRRDRFGWRDWAVMGLLNNLAPFVLIVWGQRTIGAGLASIFNATTPIFGVLVAHFLTRDDRLTVGRSAGIALAFVGVAVMVGVDALAGLGDNILADLACLTASCSYGFSALWARRFRGHPPIATAAGQLICSAVVLAPLVLIVDRPWTAGLPSAAAIGSIVALATLSTAIAYILFFRLTTLVGPTNTILVTFLIPPSAILLGIVVLGERPAPQHLVGVALICVGLAAIDGRLLRRASRPNRGP